MEVTTRFKELDLVDRMPEELWTEICNAVEEAVTKTITMKKKCKIMKWWSEEVLQVAKERRESNSKGESKAYS